MANYEIQELVEWDNRIRARAAEFGLSWFPQEFEICDHVGMLGYMAYSGMPSHYPTGRTARPTRSSRRCTTTG
jgi:stage V sporulation protein R